MNKQAKKHKHIFNQDFWGRRIYDLKGTILVRFCKCGMRRA